MFMRECVLLYVSFGMVCVCVCVQYHDGLWKETVSESVGTSLNGPVVFPRG